MHALVLLLANQCTRSHFSCHLQWSPVDTDRGNLLHPRYWCRMLLQRNQQQSSIRLWLEKEKERENIMYLYHNNFFMRVGYLHRLQDRLVDRDYSSIVFHRPYYKMPSNFQHCPLAPHSMQILAVCDTFAWLVGCDISKDVCPAHPSNFSWSPNIHVLLYS